MLQLSLQEFLLKFWERGQGFEKRALRYQEGLARFLANTSAFYGKRCGVLIGQQYGYCSSGNTTSLIEGQKLPREA
jgi:hypothetical protein